MKQQIYVNFLKVKIKKSNNILEKLRDKVDDSYFYRKIYKKTPWIAIMMFSVGICFPEKYVFLNLFNRYEAIKKS